MIKITPKEIELIAKYVYEASGIYLNQSKAYLFETRLHTVAKELGCRDYSELHLKAKNDPKKLFERKIIDAITTNETSFFRDKRPFELLKNKILPQLLKSKNSSAPGLKPRINIWSAASSTGQELYSIAIIIKELLGNNPPCIISLQGTDISEDAINQARIGKYNKFEIERGLDQKLLQRYFTMFGNTWKIKDEIRTMVNFKKFNLMQPFNSLGKFDIIFCRNVAIYFSLQDRKKLFNKIADSLTDDGFLIIGSTESLSGVCSRFTPQRHLNSIFYQKK